MTTNTPYASPLLSHPGAAVFQGETPLDVEGVAWHYGNPLVEQRYAETGSAIIDRSQRRVIAVTGPDAPVFLNNLLSQKLDDTADGFSACALDLDAQGHVLHAADITRVGDAFYLDVPAGQLNSFLGFLNAMIFWSKVEVAQADIAIITVLGSPLRLSDTLFTRTVTSPSALAAHRQDIAVPRTRLAEAVSQLQASGGQLAGLMAFSAQRVRAREPELAADLDDKTIAHEVPQWIGRGESLGAVHLNKGCYRGQETVARVENIGRSPRLLVMLYLDGSAPQRPKPGDEVTLGRRRVGRLGTVVDDCDFGPIALALIKRSALEDLGITFSIGDTAASLEEDSLPSNEGIKAGRAAQERLRGQC